MELTTLRGASLYTGALLGPGLLLLPGLAAAEAGPASVLAWLGLLALSGLFAVVFAALGRSFPSAGGVAGYVAAGIGDRAGRAVGWMFLAGVVAGAPFACLIGAAYVTALTGGGQLAQAGIAALLLLAVLALAAAGLRASSSAQLLLVGLLVAVVAVAVVGSAPSARAANWTPFAPHGWLAVGRAATTLMLSFAGWEAAAPLTARFKDPARQLPRVVAIALAVTSVLYLGLAASMIGVLGRNSDTLVPLAALLRTAAGPAGTAGAAAAAVVLTLGATNAYLNGAAEMARALFRPRRSADAASAVSAVSPPSAASPASAMNAGTAAAADPRQSAFPLFAAIAASGLVLITLYGFGLVSPASLIAIPTTLFLAVYLGCMAAAARLLHGPARWAALPATVAVLVMLGFCGWALAAPAAIAAVTAVVAFRRRKPQGASSPEPVQRPEYAASAAS